MSNMLLNEKELKILNVFSSNYSKMVYGRDVAKNLGFNQKSVSNILKGLEGKNVLKYRVEGRNKYYFLNRMNGGIKEIVKLIEINKKILFLKDSKIVELLIKLERKTDGVLIVFGSYASGRNKKSSDLDLFVVGNIADVGDLREIYGIDINVVRTTFGKFDKGDVIIKEVMGNHVVLKGVEEFVNLIW